MVRRSILTASLVLACTGTVWGAIGAEEAKRLGTSLTAIGAEKAGNAEGTIPAYTGGLTSSPAGFTKGTRKRPDPFSKERPLYSIDVKNEAKYNDKLTEGAKALIKRFPSYRIDVYPTHRTVAMPRAVQENTIKAAPVAKTSNNGLSLVGVHAAYPFPIPKNGNEAMWNHMLRYQGEALFLNMQAVYTNSAGTSTMVNQSDNPFEFPYWVPSDKTNDYWRLKTVMTGPARRAGEAILTIDPTDWFAKKRSAWQYLPGQRRVKMAPEIGYDTPDFNISGATTFDDVFIFTGAIDRYDFKLVGKKEMLIPYNSYKLVYQSTKEKLFGPKHLNPDYVRWELHRVWIVEATLKPGKRHLYSRRTFYLDEDSWFALASDEYDGHGKLYRTGFAYMAPSYDVSIPFAATHGIYDLVANSYTINFWVAENGEMKHVKPFPAKEWSADSLAGSGVR